MWSSNSDNITSYDVENIESIEKVMYNNEEVSFLEGVDQRFNPIYRLINEFPDIKGERDFQTMDQESINKINQYADKYQEQVEQDLFEVYVNDEEEGTICFQAERINNHDARFTNTPNSSIGFKSPDNEVFTLKIARNYNNLEHIFGEYSEGINEIPEKWKEMSSSEWFEPRPSQKYSLQEPEFLTAMEGINNQLQESDHYTSIFPNNHRYVEENSNPRFEMSDRDIAIIQEWSDQSTIKTEQEAELRGRYAATLDKLGLYRMDREPSEILSDESENVFEVDRERIIYSMNPDRNFYELVTNVMPRRGEVEDPRFLEKIAKGQYREVKRRDEDLSTLIAENLSEWNAAEMPEDRFLDWYWENPYNRVETSDQKFKIKQ